MMREEIHGKLEVDEARRGHQVELAGASSQNSYRGAEQPAEVAVKVIAVPGACGETGSAESDADVQVPIKS